MVYDKEQIEIEMIQRFLECADHDILEIGCGKGTTSSLLAPKARTYIAIDPDSNSLDQARSLYPGVDFRIGNGEALDFPDGSFNGVLYTLSLHHQNSRLALQESHRVLTEQGQAVIVEPVADGEFQQLFNLFNDETTALNQARNAIKESDFRIEHHEIFRVKVLFENIEELCNYPFDRSIYNPDDPERILDTLRKLRGSDFFGQPIQLHETLHICSLRKSAII